MIFKEGATAIYNLQTGHYTPTPLGELKPSQVDLREHEEIRVWSVAENDWVPPDPEPTVQQKILMDIRAYLDAACDRLDELEKLL